MACHAGHDATVRVMPTLMQAEHLCCLPDTSEAILFDRVIYLDGREAMDQNVNLHSRQAYMVLALTLALQ